MVGVLVASRPLDMKDVLSLEERIETKEALC